MLTDVAIEPQAQRESQRNIELIMRMGRTGEAAKPLPEDLAVLVALEGEKGGFGAFIGRHGGTNPTGRVRGRDSMRA
jgi:hypothetical protein